MLRKEIDRPIPLKPLSDALQKDISADVEEARRASFKALEEKGTLDRIHKNATEKASPEEHAYVADVTLSDLRNPFNNLVARLQATLGDHSKPIYDAGGNTGRIRLGVAGNFDLRNVATLEALQARASELGQFFADDLIDDLVATITKGFYDEGLNPLQVGARIAQKFDQFSIGRANATARTETLIGSEQATFEVYKTSEVEYKRWLCTFRNSRQTHMDAHGQRKRMDEPFEVGAWLMMHPGDPSAGAEELVHCQCTFLPELEGVEIIAEDIWDGA